MEIKKDIEKDSFRDWLVDTIYDAIHNLTTEDSEINQIARTFSRDDAEFTVDMDYMFSYEDDTREYIPYEEANKYLAELIQSTIDDLFI